MRIEINNRILSQTAALQKEGTAETCNAIPATTELSGDVKDDFEDLIYGDDKEPVLCE